MVSKPTIYESTTGLFTSRLITTADIADDAITSAKIAAEAVGTSELASGAITTAKIQDGAVTYSKLSISGQILESDLAPGISIDISEIVKEPNLTAIEAISKGKAVYINSSGRIGVSLATDATKLPAIGVAYTSIASGSIGDVVLRGRLDGYNFSGYIGEELFVGTDGSLTVTPPSSSGNIQQKMGVAYKIDSALINPSTELVQIA